MNRESFRKKWPSAPSWLKAALLVLAILTGAGLTLRSLPGSTVILVRHAERYHEPGDPSLTPEGAARAERLAALFGDKGGTPVARVFSSEVRRTHDTAEPLAHKLGLPVTVVPAKDMTGLLSQIRAASREGASVVVGHSNTVPMLVSQLTKGRFSPTPDDDDFSSIFVVHVAFIGPPSVIRLHY